jgi:hypothetical protein
MLINQEDKNTSGPLHINANGLSTKNQGAELLQRLEN